MYGDIHSLQEKKLYCISTSTTGEIPGQHNRYSLMGLDLMQDVKVTGKYSVTMKVWGFGRDIRKVMLGGDSIQFR